MTAGRIIRLLLLATCVVLGWTCFSHGDAYQVKGSPGDFIDPSDGAYFTESELDGRLFRFAAALLVTLVVYTFHWAHAHRMASGALPTVDEDEVSSGARSRAARTGRRW